jgi:hypothetical protein
MNGAVHTLLKWQGIPCGDPIRPARPLAESDEKILRTALEEAGLVEILRI